MNALYRLFIIDKSLILYVSYSESDLYLEDSYKLLIIVVIVLFRMLKLFL